MINRRRFDSNENIVKGKLQVSRVFLRVLWMNDDISTHSIMHNSEDRDDDDYDTSDEEVTIRRTKIRLNNAYTSVESTF